MRRQYHRLVVALIACLGMASPAFGETWTVVDRFTVPGRLILGMAFESGNLWITSERPGLSDMSIISQVDPRTHQVIRQSASLPWNARGICVGAGSLWVTDAAADQVHEVDAASLTEVRSFTSHGPEPCGIAYDGAMLWLIDPCVRSVYQLSTTGEIVSQFGVPNINRQGLEWNGSGLVTNADMSALIVYSPSGEIVGMETLQGLPSGARVFDVAFGDGKLYVSAHNPSSDEDRSTICVLESESQRNAGLSASAGGDGGSSGSEPGGTLGAPGGSSEMGGDGSFGARRDMNSGRGGEVGATGRGLRPTTWTLNGPIGLVALIAALLGLLLGMILRSPRTRRDEQLEEGLEPEDRASQTRSGNPGHTVALVSLVVIVVLVLAGVAAYAHVQPRAKAIAQKQEKLHARLAALQGVHPSSRRQFGQYIAQVEQISEGAHNGDAGTQPLSDWEQAIGLALGIQDPSQTPYGLECASLLLRHERCAELAQAYQSTESQSPSGWRLVGRTMILLLNPATDIQDVDNYVRYVTSEGGQADAQVLAASMKDANARLAQAARDGADQAGPVLVDLQAQALETGDHINQRTEEVFQWAQEEGTRRAQDAAQQTQMQWQQTQREAAAEAARRMQEAQQQAQEQWRQGSASAQEQARQAQQQAKEQARQAQQQAQEQMQRAAQEAQQKAQEMADRLKEMFKSK